MATVYKPNAVLTRPRRASVAADEDVKTQGNEPKGKEKSEKEKGQKK